MQVEVQFPELDFCRKSQELKRPRRLWFGPQAAESRIRETMLSNRGYGNGAGAFSLLDAASQVQILELGPRRPRSTVEFRTECHAIPGEMFTALSGAMSVELPSRIPAVCCGGIIFAASHCGLEEHSSSRSSQIAREGLVPKA